MVIPGVFVFLLSCAVMGAVARLEEIRSAAPEFKGTQVLQVLKVHPGASPWEAAQTQILSFVFAATHIPEVCLVGAYNDFQAKQCKDFWRRLGISGAVAIIPFVVGGIFLWLCWDNLNFVYRRAQRKIESGEALASGVVTQPAGGGESVFSYFHCLRPVRIQTMRGTQVTAFMTLGDELPKPGTQVALFDGGKLLGAQRQFALVHTPHVAVVRGSR